LGRDALLRLQDMHESIEAAFRLIEGLKRTDLDGDEARYAACMYRILVVAEAAKHLPKTLLARYPDISWGELIRMGDMLRHQYFRIEADVVWDTIKDDFPALLRVVKRMLKEETVDA
jgi:uncharacterized protein with HEPN domain